ncbi:MULTISPECIES: polysaccharide deacetylase family protein [Natrialbaceae]|uniref:polysaccharide deacetylase family protein n=1 Tax=Natrialbaceae TaxID=1644061 RepID=UPI00207D4932|nr:polysaccharide deacetylase family protein [Natronococcus sp. CG52]
MNDKAARRALLGTVGAGTLALCAGCLDPRTGGSGGEPIDDDEEPDDDTNESEDLDEVPDIDGGAVVFTYDDGPIEDYEQAFPVHQEFDAPASTAIVTEWVGREDFLGTDWMDIEHLEELEEAGWEIMSHTTDHTGVASFELVEDVNPDDTRIYPERPHHGFHGGYDVEITDGENSVQQPIVDSGTDDVGNYLEFDEAIGESFAAGEAVERYPEDLMHEFLGNSKERLERWGFEIDTFLAPYDVCDEWTIGIAEEYYDGIANTSPTSIINDPETFDPFETKRDYFIEFTSPVNTRKMIEEIAMQEAIGVVGAHTFKEEVTEERIRETLEWVEEYDLEVVTFRDAIRATAADSARAVAVGAEK